MSLYVDGTSASPVIDPREDANENGSDNFPDDPTISIDADLRFLDGDLDGVLDGDEDDGLGGYVSPESVDDIYLRDSGADGNDDLPAAERQSRMWKIDHSFGNYKYKCISSCLVFHRDILLCFFAWIRADWRLMGFV